MHVGRGGQAGQLEPGEAPQAQAFGDHRVQIALGPVLLRYTVRSLAEGEPGRPGVACPAYRHRDPLDGGRDDAELAADPRGAGVRVVVGLVLGGLGRHVEVDEHGTAGREGAGQLGQVGFRRAFRALGDGRDDQVVLPVVGVLGGQQRAAVALGDLDVLQRPDPVVAPGHHLEHDRVVPLGEDAEDRRA